MSRRVHDIQKFRKPRAAQRQLVELAEVAQSLPPSGGVPGYIVCFPGEPSLRIWVRAMSKAHALYKALEVGDVQQFLAKHGEVSPSVMAAKRPETMAEGVLWP